MPLFGLAGVREEGRSAEDEWIDGWKEEGGRSEADRG